MSLRKMGADLVSLAKDNSLTDNALRFNPLYYSHASTVIRRGHENPQEARRTAGELLERALSWAAETKYGERFGSNLEDWPVLSKTDILANPSQFRRHRQLAIPAATSGSTGRPLPLWRSLECVAAEQALIDSLLGENGRPMLKERIAVLRADHVKDPSDLSPPFGIWRNKRRRLILSSAHLTPANLPWFVETLSSFQPDVLWVYPSALSNLLHLTGEAGAKLSVPTVLSSSEMMSEALFHYAGQSLQARVIDHYGQAERVCSAHCDSVREYRFNPAYGHVELFPEPFDSIGGPITARIIATGYWNSAFPLVRYDTGDRVVLRQFSDAGELKRIAEGEQSFSDIIGRADDYVIGRDGEKITGINHIPRELDAVLRVQVIQESRTRIRTLVLSKGELTAHDRSTLERNARQFLPPYMDLDIEAVGELISLPNGKTPFIIRRPDGSELTAHRNLAPESPAPTAH